MLLLSAVLIAVVSNLDNLAVGVAFGMRDKTIAAKPNVIIATVTMAGTAGAMAFGQTLSRLMPPSVATLLGSSIIIAIGVGTLVASLDAVLARSHAPIPRAPRLRSDPQGNADVSYREALTLGVALSLNNVGAGIGAGVAGIPPFATTMLAGAFSLLFVGGGSHAGWSLGRRLLGRRASIVAGLALMSVGTATLAGAG